MSLALYSSVQAQGEPCGVNISPELNAYFIDEVDDIEQFTTERQSNPVTVVPVRVTNITGPTGISPLTQSDVDAAINRLNVSFAPINIVFQQCGSLNEIWDDRIKNNVDIDKFITSFTYTSGAMEVYVKPGNIAAGIAALPCPIAFQAANPNWPVSVCTEHQNWVYFNQAPNFSNYTTLQHEVGHHFSLLHTQHVVQNYHLPVDNTQLDHPYPVLDQNNNIVPGWWGRELVIRSNVPTGKNFLTANSLTSGDLVADTPADCSPYFSGSSIWPGCNEFSQRPDCSLDINLLTYEDYNGDKIYPPPAPYTLGRNYMSYWADPCRNKFTQGQYNRMAYFNIIYRQPEYTPGFCGNFTDNIQFEGTSTGLHNVTARIRHPNTPRKCNVTTSLLGNFSGMLHQNELTTHIYHNGKSNALAFANDPLKMHYAHLDCEWLEGVSTADLVAISKHILGTGTTPLDGYSIIAADANKSNSVTTFDIVELRKLILGIYSKLPNHEQPWRYIPEFIPQDVASGFDTNPFNVTVNSVQVYADYLNQGWLFYYPPSAAASQTGFDGIKIGDVNGSWPADDKSFCDQNSLEPIIPENVTLSVPASSLSVDDEVILSVKTLNFDSIEAFQFGLHIPFESVDVLSVNSSTLAGYEETENFGLNNLENNQLRTLWFDPNGVKRSLSDTSVLFSITVKAKQAIPNLSSLLYLDDAILKNEVWKGNTGGTTAPSLALFITVEESSGERSNRNNYLNNDGALSVIPNPTTGRMQILYFHKGNVSNAELKLTDANGRLVSSSQVEVRSGENTIENTDLSHAPIGVYVLQLIVGEQLYTKKVVKEQAN